MPINVRINATQWRLMALVAPWFAFVLWHHARGDTPLPRRVASHALDIIGKLEHAAGYLLMACMHGALQRRGNLAALMNMTQCLAAMSAHNCHDTITIDILRRRIVAVWQLVLNLKTIARNLARRWVWQCFLTTMAARIASHECGQRHAVCPRPTARISVPP